MKAREVHYVRILRNGVERTYGNLPTTTVAERLLQVWEMTEQCLAWTRGSDHVGQSRLQRSVCRVQRRRR